MLNISILLCTFNGSTSYARNLHKMQFCKLVIRVKKIFIEIKIFRKLIFCTFHQYLRDDILLCLWVLNNVSIFTPTLWLLNELLVRYSFMLLRQTWMHLYFNIIVCCSIFYTMRKLIVYLKYFDKLLPPSRYLWY